MDQRLDSLYEVPNIVAYEDVSLQMLRENCMSLEYQLHEIMERLPEADRQIIEAYLDMRDELEFHCVKTALRWGKRHYK